MSVHLPIRCDAISSCTNLPVAHYSVLSQIVGLCSEHISLAPKGRVIHEVTARLD